jgi:hypothetical protein
MRKSSPKSYVLSQIPRIWIKRTILTGKESNHGDYLSELFLPESVWYRCHFLRLSKWSKNGGNYMSLSPTHHGEIPDYVLHRELHSLSKNVESDRNCRSLHRAIHYENSIDQIGADQNYIGRTATRKIRGFSWTRIVLITLNWLPGVKPDRPRIP